MDANLRNRNRGYQQLRVWQDAIALYGLTCRVFRKFPFELKRVASQAIAASDSVHRNIAEGYCRRSLKEYLNFLNYTFGSLGESVSGFIAYQKAHQISETDFDELNGLAYKIENGLLKLVEGLQRKMTGETWDDACVIKETNASYGDTEWSQRADTPAPQPPNIPFPQHSAAPSPHTPIPPSPLS